MNKKPETLRIPQFASHDRNYILFCMNRRSTIGPSTGRPGDILEIEQCVEGIWYHRYYKIVGEGEPEYRSQTFEYEVIRLVGKAKAEEEVQKVLDPQYDHDCDHCEFLGRKDSYDLYYCRSKVFGGSVIARYGSGGSEYASTPIGIFAYGQFESRSGQALKEGCRRAVKGHFTFDYPKALASLKAGHDTALGLFNEELREFYGRHCKKSLEEAFAASGTTDIVEQLRVLYQVADLLTYFKYELGYYSQLTFDGSKIELGRIDEEEGDL